MFGSTAMDLSLALILFITLPCQAFQSEVVLHVNVSSAPTVREEYCNDEFGDDLAEDVNGMVLLQTDIVMSESVGKKSGSHGVKTKGVWDSVKQTCWAILGRSEKPSAQATQAAENVKRFHRDFIAAALLMCCVLPWSRQRQEEEDGHGSERLSAGYAEVEARESSRSAAINSLCFDLPNGLLHVFPAFHSLRYISVLVLFLQHYWFQGSFIGSQILLLLGGFSLDFAETRQSSEDSIWIKYASTIPERFTRLYPVYALHVILCYLIFPVPGLDGTIFHQAFSGAAWVFSVAYGSYILMPVLTDQPHDVPDNVVAMLSAACVALVVLPRTLACAVTSMAPESPSSFHSNQKAAMADMIFAHKALLNGLAYFFAGIVIARGCLSLTVFSRSMEPPSQETEEETDLKDREAEMDLKDREADYKDILDTDSLFSE